MFAPIEENSLPDDIGDLIALYLESGAMSEGQWEQLHSWLEVSPLHQERFVALFKSHLMIDELLKDRYGGQAPG